MKKQFAFLWLAILAAYQSVVAQTIPFLTIQQIQTVSGANLANCNDSSSYTGKLVVTRGIVVTAPVINIGGTATGINAIGDETCNGAFYIQNGTGPFSGILVRQSLTKKNGTTGILQLNVGDSVVVRGTVREYAVIANSSGHNYPGETHIDLDTTLTYAAAKVNVPVQGPTLINISDLSIGQSGNNIVNGEQWEGVYVKVVNSIVNQAPNSTNGTGASTGFPGACAPPSGSRRRRIVVSDVAGNELVVSDRFVAGRFSSPATPNNSPGASGNQEVGVQGGTLMYPTLGSYYTTLAGVVSHWLNSAGGCTSRLVISPSGILSATQPPNDGSSTASNQGYVLNPFLPSHYQLGHPVPTISNIVTLVDNNPTANPLPGQDVVIQASISQQSFALVTLTLVPSSLVVKYTTDPITSTSPVWNTLTLSSTSGSNFAATIPGSGFTDGTLVRYFVKATNSDLVTVVSPEDTTQSNFFYVRSNGTNIYDLQYTPYPDGNSQFAGYNGLLGAITVTVPGVVAATYNDLGIVYIQQENVHEWGGIKVFPAGQISGATNSNIQSSLKALNRGQRVTIVGQVSENYQETVLNATQVILGNGTANLVFTKHPASISLNNQEQYEGVLVRIAESPNKKLHVVNNYISSARGGFTIGPDSTAPLATSLIMTGVQDSRSLVWTYSSLVATFLRSKIRETGGNDGYIGANIPVLDTVNTNTKLDSLNGLVTYNFNNYIITPRDNKDFYGINGYVETFNSNANPISFTASVSGLNSHQLTWIVPANYGGDGFILDYGAPLSTNTVSPSISNFSDRTFKRLAVVSATTTGFTRLNVPVGAGYLYRIRGFKAINTADTVSSYAAIQLLSNITGTSTLGITNNDLKNQTYVSVFPNPTSDILNYVIHLTNLPNDLNIKIYDISGRAVFEEQVNHPISEGTLELGYLKSGVYIAEFSTNEKVISRSRILLLD